MSKGKVLFVANVAKEHILKFHVPTLKMLQDEEYLVDVACSGNEEIPYCQNQFKMKYKRNPISFKTFVGIRQLRGIIRKNNYDLISCHTPTGGVVARLAILGMKDKPFLMYTAHGFHFFKGAPLINWLIYFPIEWILSFLTDCLVVINKEDYNNALKFHFGMKNIHLINGLGVQINKFKKSMSKQEKESLKKELGLKNEKILIYVAEILKNKNQIVLLKMIKQLLDESKDYKLLLVGPIHDNGECQNEAEKLEISQNVLFLGWRNDIANLLNIGDVYVASSIREGLGLNLVEAQYCGLPVVASMNRGHNEIIEDGVNGFLVEYNDFDGFKNKVEYLLNNKDIYEKVVKNASQSSLKFSQEHALINIKKLYKRYL